MTYDLVSSLSSPDSAANVQPGQITALNTDGTVSIDFGGGRVLLSVPVLLSGYTPAQNDVVMCVRRDVGLWLALGPVRDSNVTTTLLTQNYALPYRVLPAPSGVAAGVLTGSLTVNAVSTGSWREADGWSKNEPYQGAFSTARGYYRGLYFYGTGFASLKGRVCTSVTIRLHRNTAIGALGVGSAAGIGQYIATHVHATRPVGAPVFTTPATVAGFITAPDDVQVRTLTLPVSWGQALLDGRARGVGHLYLGTTAYSRCKSVAEDAASGQIVIGWRS